MNNKTPDNGFAKQLKDKILNGEIALDELDVTQLNELIDWELTLICLEQGDTEFIDKCAAVINEKSGDGEYADAFDNALEKARKRVKITDAIVKNENRRKAPGLKRILILTATFITVIAMGLVLFSADYGMDEDKYLLMVAKGGPGTVINVGNYTFYCPAFIVKYNSIDDYLENEDYDIFYPTAFPNGHQLSYIKISPDDKDHINITFYSTNRNPYSGYRVFILKDAPGGDLSYDRVKYEKHGIAFYFDTDNDRYRGHVMAYALNGTDYYYISASTYDELIYIIDNLRSTKE